MTRRIVHTVRAELAIGLAAAVLLSGPAAVRAQAPLPPPADGNAGAKMRVPPPGPDGPMGPEETVKGRPYSATVVTEFTQTLSDGNRIVQHREAPVYRDAAGRVRREHTFTGMMALGFQAAAEGRTIITIDDPVAGTRYVLDPERRTAAKMPAFRRDQASARDGGKGPREPRRKGGPAPTTESLGTRTIDGLDASGTRTTFTIPAGEIGNELPIEIVHERWVAPELGVTVLTRFVDPRMGERTFRLTNIQRQPPAADLFEVPAEYRVLDRTAPRKMRRPAPEE